VSPTPGGRRPSTAGRPGWTVSTTCSGVCPSSLGTTASSSRTIPPVGESAGPSLSWGWSSSPEGRSSASEADEAPAPAPRRDASEGADLGPFRHLGLRLTSLDHVSEPCAAPGPQPQATSTKGYSGVDNLEVMEVATNYRRYLTHLVSSVAGPVEGRRLLDFGVGVGTHAEELR